MAIFAVFYYLLLGDTLAAALFFTNVSNTGCIGVNLNADLRMSTIATTKNNTIVFNAIYTGAQDIVIFDINNSYANYADRIKNYTVDRPRGSVSFCIINTTFKDGGDYKFDVAASTNNINGTARLYVLGQPEKANLHIEKEGIVDTRVAHLSCRSQANSSPPGLPLKYIWKVNDTGIIETIKYRYNGTYKEELFINVSRDDRFNNYTCAAQEEHGQTSGFSTVKHIDPKVVPVVTLEPVVGQYNVIEYTKFVIKCIILEAYPNVSSYQWLRSTTPLPVTTQTYVFENVTKNDAFSYSCIASNDIGVNGSATIHLTVLHGPVIIPIPSVYQEEGRGINITCTVESNPTATDHNVTWTKHGNTTFSEKGLQLSIPSLNRADNGTFICTVHLTLDASNGSSVTKSNFGNAQVNVLYGPVIKPMVAISQNEGTNINITCKTESNPTAKDQDVTWTKKGNGSFIQTGVRLFIPSAYRSDHGTYTCSVTIQLSTSDGNSIYRSASADVEINILYQATVIELNSVETTEDMFVNLTCKVNGNPLPNISWTYVETTTAVKETYIIPTSFDSVLSILEFLPAKCENAGTYQCLVNNHIQSSSHRNATLRVFCSPHIMIQSAERRNITIQKGHPLNFTAWFYAYPRPTFEWYFNQTSLSSIDHEFNITTLQTLVPSIFGAQLVKSLITSENIGLYILETSNSVGSIKEMFNIYFQREPDPPETISVICTTSLKAANISWKAGWNGGTPQIFDILYKTKGAVNFANGNFNIDDGNPQRIYSHLVWNLLPNQIYIFKTTAMNTIGSADSLDEVNCSLTDTRTENEPSDYVTAIGAGTGCAVGICVIICVGIFVYYQRRSAERKDKEIELLHKRVERKHEISDDEDDLKDNICYISGDQVLQSGSGVEYAVVKTKHARDPSKASADTANVESKNKGDVNHHKDCGEQTMKYLHPGKNLNKNAQKKNKDGLIYADLQFKFKLHAENKIHGKENRTQYVDIDFSKKAEPLPDTDSEDEDKIRECDVKEKDAKDD